MGISIAGLDELNRFGVELGKISGKALTETDAVLEKGALKIKEDLVAGVKTSKHFSGKKKASLEAGISYDSKYSVGTARYEIGPEIGRAGGSLGHVYYLGTSRGGGTGDLEGPLMREAPEVYNRLNKLVDGWANRL